MPPLQAGSSIMPGKVNPVAAEAAAQAALLVVGNDVSLTMAAASANLELCQYMPVIAHTLLENVHLLSRACSILSGKCVNGMIANEGACAAQVENATATVTALIGHLGYALAGEIAAEARSTGRTIKSIVAERKLLTPEMFEQLTSPEATCKLGN